MRRYVFSLSALCLAGSMLPAQVGPSPQDQLRRIAAKVSDEMQAIDRLLAQREIGKAATEAAKRSADGLQKMLDEAQGTSKSVQKGIDELIEELSKSGL
jgi:hypothetical protein